MHEDRFIRQPEAQTILGGISGTTFKRLVAEGTIPPGRRLPGTGAQSGGPLWWRESDIRAALAEILRKREARHARTAA